MLAYTLFSLVGGAIGLSPFLLKARAAQRRRLALLRSAVGRSS